jgi:hypothetical protein
MSTSIPAFHVSDASHVEGAGDVFIASRKDATSTGVFSIKLSVKFDPLVDTYPAGSMVIKSDLAEGSKGAFTATSVELIDSYAKLSPTVFLTGRCNADLQAGHEAAKGLRYWVMIANNKAARDKEGTPDVVGFAVHDRTGARVAYGTGPVRAGDFNVTPK